MVFFSKKSVKLTPRDEVFEYDVGMYVRTYAIPLAILRLVGLRTTPHSSNISRFVCDAFYWFQFVNLFVVTWLELIKMGQTARGGSFQDAIDIFRMMPCIGYLLVAMAKSYKMVIHRHVFENLFSELREMWPVGRVTLEEHQILKRAFTQLSYIVKGYYWCNNALLVIYLSPPFVKYAKQSLGYGETLVFPFFYWFPFDPFQKIYYEIILVLQTWHALITIWFMLCGDLLFCIYLCHITTQFDLLSVRIKKLIYVPIDQQLIPEYPLAAYTSKRLRSEKITNFDDPAWERKYRLELANIITRHRALIRLSGDVENMFSFALLVNFFNSSIIICFCGFCSVVAEKWNEIVYKSFLVTALTQTWLICLYGQKLLESSSYVCEAIYNSGWYKASQKIKKSMLFMILRTQKEVHVTTYGFSVISLSSYTTIIKTSWSYFTLLLNIYKQ